MNQDLLQSLRHIKALTEAVCACHRRGTLCRWLQGDCPSGEASLWDNRTDIYRIGTLLFPEIISSPVPYRPHLYRQIEDLLAVSISLNPTEQGHLCVILKRCLHPRPQGRYSCCEELISALEELIGILTDDAEPPS